MCVRDIGWAMLIGAGSAQWSRHLPAKPRRAALPLLGGAFLAAVRRHEVLSNPGASKFVLLHQCFVF